MASGAVRPEFAIVDVLVAGGTFAGFHAEPVLKNVLWGGGGHAVALGAVHLFMLAF